VKSYSKLNNYKQIATDNNVSSSTVIRRVNKHVKTISRELPEVLSFDEFKKANNGRGKYAFCIAVPVNKKVILLKENRRSNWLRSYFSRVPYESRKRVKAVITDLWVPYRTIVREYFPNPKLIADKFHFLRNLLWAFNDVRVRIMNTYDRKTTEYKFLKKYWKVFNKPDCSLSKKYYYNKLVGRELNELGIHDYASSIDAELEEAFMLKDFFHNNMNALHDKKTTRHFMTEWILMLRGSNLPEFRKLADTFVNWKEEIINGLYIRDENEKHYRNGFIEGVNNLIKVIKRLAFGFRNFDNFLKVNNGRI